MPPTRKPPPGFLQPTRKITRRRYRKTTWIDLLRLHSRATANQPPDSLKSFHCHESSVRQAEPETPVAHPIRQSYDVDESQTYNSSSSSDSGGDANSNIMNSDPLSPVMNPIFCSTVDESDSEPEKNNEMDERVRGKSIDSDASLLKDIECKCKLALTSSTIIALTLVCGSVRFSVQQYEIVRSIIRYAKEGTELPSYSTVKRRLLPHFTVNCFAKSTVKSFPMQRSHVVTEVRHVSSRNNMNRNLSHRNARIVYPTEWAKIDVATLPVYRNIFHHSANDCHSGHSKSCSMFDIETTPIVLNRSAFLNPTTHLLVETPFGGIPAIENDQISITIPCVSQQHVSHMLRQNHYDITKTQECVTIQGYICASWCVSAEGHKTPSLVRAINNSPPFLHRIILEFAERAVLESSLASKARTKASKGTRQHFFTTSHVRENHGEVRVGDICTLIRPKQGTSHATLYGIIVSQFWKSHRGAASQFVLWIELRKERSMDPSCISIPAVLAAQPLLGNPLLVGNPNQSNRLAWSDNPGNTGKLEDGRNYVTYRVMLYCDDFKQGASQYSSNSAGGVYLLPLGLSLQARMSRSAVHVISLTPPGVSTNEILLDIIPDIVKGSTTGVRGVTPDGHEVVIFLDVVGYIADYPAAAAPIDVIGHSGDSPCTHCNIRKLKGEPGSMLGFTTKVHSSSSAALRCGERNLAIRNAKISDREANVLGMKPTSTLTDRRCPLLALQRELDVARPNVPLSKKGVPVVPCEFDAFRSNMIAPDHLLSGLTRNVIELFFSVLTPRERELADISICATLESNRLPRERSVYNEKKGQLHSMSITSLYCLLFVAPPVLNNFRRHNDEIRDITHSLVYQLQHLVALTNMLPCDFQHAGHLRRTNDVTNSDLEYIKRLRDLATKYVVDVNNFCTKYKERGSILDKPNLHRLLELYNHTIPAFGHASHVFELVFEASHQPLKRCISRGNHQEAEVSAVEHCIGNDWQSRLALLHYYSKSNDNQTKTQAMHGLRRLLLGDVMEELCGGNSDCDGLLRSIDSQILELFNAAVLHILKSKGNINAALGLQTCKWDLMKGIPPHTEAGVSKALWDTNSLMEWAKQYLTIQKGHFGSEKPIVEVVWKARKVRSSDMKQWKTSNSWETLETETIIEAQISTGTERDEILRPEFSERSTRKIFAIVGFLGGLAQGPWIVCVPLIEERGGLVRSPRVVHPSNGKIVQLNENVRRVAVHHVCDFNGLCQINVDRKVVVHGERIFSGGLFRIQCKEDGYPPRMA